MLTFIIAHTDAKFVLIELVSSLLFFISVNLFSMPRHFTMTNMFIRDDCFKIINLQLIKLLYF